MSLDSLEVANFRCIRHADLALDPNCTLIVGENASGKTSLLEAIFVLSCGRSFRAGSTDSLIQDGADQFRVVAKVSAGSIVTVVGAEVSRSATEIRVGGQRAKSFADVASLLPVRVIDPEVHRLLEDGSRLRRRFMDWGVFHVEPRFFDAWRRYQVALRQRNAAIKSRATSQDVSAWDRELVAAGGFVAESRQSYLEKLAPHVAAVTTALLGFAVELKHRMGWADGQSFEEALKAAWGRDQRYGVTTVGPHRADLIASVEGEAAKQRVSRGQQKLLVAGLMLAQLRLRHQRPGDKGLLLLDDPAAELDVDNLGKLMAEVATTPAQLLVTTTQKIGLEGCTPGAMFHVKHGQIHTLQ